MSMVSPTPDTRHSGASTQLYISVRGVWSYEEKRGITCS